MTVLAVDPDPGTTSRLARPLRALGYRLETCARADRALEMIRERRFHVILTAARLPGGMSRRMLKSSSGRRHPHAAFEVTSMAPSSLAS
jgi:DNA-binding NtrC family response regulator